MNLSAVNSLAWLAVSGLLTIRIDIPALSDHHEITMASAGRDRCAHALIRAVSRISTRAHVEKQESVQVLTQQARVRAPRRNDAVVSVTIPKRVNRPSPRSNRLGGLAGGARQRLEVDPRVARATR